MFGQNESLINKTCVAVMNCKTSHFYKSIRSLATKVQPTISAIPLIFKILFFRENERRKIYLWTEFLFEKKKIAGGHLQVVIFDLAHSKLKTWTSGDLWPFYYQLFYLFFWKTRESIMKSSSSSESKAFSRSTTTQLTEVLP